MVVHSQNNDERDGEEEEVVPDDICPPGELMYRVMGLSGLSASSQSSCDTMDADVPSSIDP